MAKADKLTPKQEAFCNEYLVDLNATQAAIRAGYSEATAKEMGYENLTKPHIADEVARLKAIRSERVEINQDYVLDTIVGVIERCKDDEDKKLSGHIIKGAELLGRHLGTFEADKVDPHIHIHLPEKASSL
ncbi:MAG: terminase small subunit [Pseudomonadota bacterium]